MMDCELWGKQADQRDDDAWQTATCVKTAADRMESFAGLMEGGCWSMNSLARARNYGPDGFKQIFSVCLYAIVNIQEQLAVLS